MSGKAWISGETYWEDCVEIKCARCGEPLEVDQSHNNTITVQPHLCDCDMNSRRRTFSDHLIDAAALFTRFKPINTPEEFAEFIANEKLHFDTSVTEGIVK